MSSTGQVSGVAWGLATVAGGVGAVCLLVNLLFPWVKYDLVTVKTLVSMLFKVRKWTKRKIFIIDMFEEHAYRQPDKTFIISEDQHYSYGYVEKQANKVGNAFCGMGLRQGDVVALLFNNDIDYVITYLGLSKLGIPLVLLNFNLRSASLLHCLKVSDAKTLIIGNSKELVEAVKDIQKDLGDIDMYVYGKQNLSKDMTPLDPILENALDDPVILGLREKVTTSDPACYVYTSGTTGMPKAAIVTHLKSLKAATFMDMGHAKHDDVVYTAMPLYHSAGVLIGMGCTISLGATMVIKKKFSASSFFDDCIKYKVTVIQYIGEMCRYLLATSPSSKDKAHSVRMAIGNGLRMDIWQEFQQRFNIANIIEFYAATEGNVGFLNVVNKTGAVGRGSPFYKLIYPIEFVKYDYIKEEPVRNEHGFCIKANKEEAGLMIGVIKKDFEYDGYKGPQEQTNKKIMRNVFKKGDAYFNTGDLFTRDNEYFVYFADRTGDTYRWKGENVSTTEVSNKITEMSWIEDANVYGVQVEGNDGRAGMVAISRVQGHQTTADDLQDLFQHCCKVLPSYAIPRFLRIQEILEVTSTFKQRKVDLVKQGYDPKLTQGDDLYCIDFAKKTYVPLTQSVFENINNGNIRL